MYYEDGKKVLEKPECSITYGKDIPVSLKNGRYTSDMEESVVEILSYKEWVEYFHCNPRVVDCVTERVEIEKGFSNGSSCDLEDVSEYISIEDYPDVEQLADRLRAVCDVARCAIRCYLHVGEYQTKLKTDVSVPNLLELSRFMHEWYKYRQVISIITNGVESTIPNNTTVIYNKLKNVTHSKDGYVYSDSKWSGCEIEEFSVDLDDNGILATMFTVVSATGYDE